MSPVPARVVRGHGVASGQGEDPRFPRGTLELQFPLFQSRRVELEQYYCGTINLDISPAKFEIIAASITLEHVDWHRDVPPETFSFFDCRIGCDAQAEPVDGLVYYPHPETKPEHFQPPNVLELLAPKIDGLTEGDEVELWLDPAQILVIKDGRSC